MAKKSSQHYVRLVNPDTGTIHYAKKTGKQSRRYKLEINKYDPKARKHCVFYEKKMPNHSK